MRPGLLAAVPAAVVLLAAAGCGIRATTVPVDAGPAPSRSACAPSDRAFTQAVGAELSAGPPGKSEADLKVVYLVCKTQVNLVIRDGRISGNRLKVARALLAELARKPTGKETRDGYESAVPRSLEILGPQAGDPEGTLRLSTGLDELPPFALGQVVCTLSHALTKGGPLRLSGPESRAVYEFECDTRLRTEPEAGMEDGTPV